MLDPAKKGLIDYQIGIILDKLSRLGSSSEQRNSQIFRARGLLEILREKKNPTIKELEAVNQLLRGTGLEEGELLH